MKLAEGIVVKANKYLENSKVLSIVSKDGMVSCLSRASNSLRSKNYSYSQVLTKINYDLTKSKRNSFDILTTGEVNYNYAKIKGDYSRLSVSLIILDAVYHLSDHIEDYPTFYLFLDEILHRIDDSNNYRYYAVIFRLKMLFLLGIGPTFSKCINCSQKEELVRFDFYSGGMKCQNCSGGEEKSYHGEMVDVMKILYLTKLSNLTDEFLTLIPDKIEEINNFLDEYYEHYIGYKSSAKDIIDKMERVIK